MLRATKFHTHTKRKVIWSYQLQNSSNDIIRWNSPEIRECRRLTTFAEWSRRRNMGINRRMTSALGTEYKEAMKCAVQKQIAFVAAEKNIQRAWSVLLALYGLTNCLLDELVIRKWVMAHKRRGPRRFRAPARAQVGSIHWLLLLKICMSRLAILREI